jgi:hypothetical protein
MWRREMKGNEEEQTSLIGCQLHHTIVRGYCFYRAPHRPATSEIMALGSARWSARSTATAPRSLGIRGCRASGLPRAPRRRNGRRNENRWTMIFRPSRAQEAIRVLEARCLIMLMRADEVQRRQLRALSGWPLVRSNVSPAPRPRREAPKKSRLASRAEGCYPFGVRGSREPP